MLYKKYHRSYVSQFKKGFRFMSNYINNKKEICEVVGEPFINEFFININIISKVIRAYTYIPVQTTIINRDGQLVKVNK